MPLYRRTASSTGGGDQYAPYVLTSLTGSLPNARQLAAGPGVSITDQGPGLDVVISATTTSSFVVPTDLGELLFAATSAQFVPCLPYVTDLGYLITQDQGYLVVSASL
jgi:hypothetical protein